MLLPSVREFLLSIPRNVVLKILNIILIVIILIV